MYDHNEADLARAVNLLREWLTLRGRLAEGHGFQVDDATIHRPAAGDPCFDRVTRLCVHGIEEGHLGREHDRWSHGKRRFQRWAFRKGSIVEDALADRAAAFVAQIQTITGEPAEDAGAAG